MNRDAVIEADRVAARLAQELPSWRLADGAIARTFATQGWKATLMVVNAIGYLAEAAWHHPDLLVSYGTVEVRLSTHSAGGITDKDFALARKIDEVVAWRPEGEAPFERPPAGSRHAILKPEG